MDIEKTMREYNCSWSEARQILMNKQSVSHNSTKVIAVKSDKETISPIFARAPFFKIIKEDGSEEFVENPYTEAVPAGPKAVELISRYNPSTVTAGNFGGLALSELEKRGIKAVKSNA